MNRFDFYQISASSTRKADLAPFVAEGRTLRTRTDYTLVGRRRYPRRRYEITVAFVDVQDGSREAVDRAVRRAQEAAPRALISARYIARD